MRTSYNQFNLEPMAIVNISLGFWFELICVMYIMCLLCLHVLLWDRNLFYSRFIFWSTIGFFLTADCVMFVSWNCLWYVRDIRLGTIQIIPSWISFDILQILFNIVYLRLFWNSYCWFLKLMWAYIGFRNPI